MSYLKSTIISNRRSVSIIVRSFGHVYSILQAYCTQVPPSSTKNKCYSQPLLFLKRTCFGMRSKKGRWPFFSIDYIKTGDTG